MKQLPLVIALSAAALCTHANAQNVQLYGKLYPYLVQESSSGVSAVGTTMSSLSSAATGVKGVPTIRGMSAGNSYLGVRGREDLGGGLKAKFQVEGVVLIDTGGGGAAFSWNRNNFVGLEGGFGEIRLGFMDTVFKEYGDTLGILGISSGTPVSSSNILRKAPFGTSSTSRFHERRANSIRYDSPELGGVEIGLQVATQENPTATLGAAKTFSLGVKYDKGPIYVALGFEQHDNFFGGSVNSPAALRNNGAGGTVTSKDTALQLTVEWRLSKDQKVEFDIINKKYDENATAAGRFKSYKNTAFMVAYDGRFAGNWRLMAHYVKSAAGSCTLVGAACNTSGLEGTQITAGLGYSLSRRTFVYAAATQITNGRSARFGATDFGSPNPGEDSRHLIAGVSHSF